MRCWGVWVGKGGVTRPTSPFLFSPACQLLIWAHNISVALRPEFQRPLFGRILSHAFSSLSASGIEMDIWWSWIWHLELFSSPFYHHYYYSIGRKSTTLAWLTRHPRFLSPARRLESFSCGWDEMYIPFCCNDHASSIYMYEWFWLSSPSRSAPYSTSLLVEQDKFNMSPTQDSENHPPIKRGVY